jgi:hypothetical protein
MLRDSSSPTCSTFRLDLKVDVGLIDTANARFTGSMSDDDMQNEEIDLSMVTFYTGRTISLSSLLLVFRLNRFIQKPERLCRATSHPLKSTSSSTSARLVSRSTVPPGYGLLYD